MLIGPFYWNNPLKGGVLVAEEDLNHIMYVCGMMARILLESGAETTRVESTIDYVGKASGVDLNCHATMTAIFISTASGSNTHLVKPNASSFNLQKVDDINTVSRRFFAHEINFIQLEQQVRTIDHKVIDFTWPQKIFGAGLVSVAPMLLFKATWSDLTLAFFIGILGYLALKWGDRHAEAPYFGAIVGGLVISLLATLLQQLGIANSAANIIISALMPLVPGVPFTNSLREIIDRDIISGLVRGIDAVMIAGSIGLGAILGSFIVHLLLGGL